MSGSGGNGTWPSFAVGNDVARTHGAYSPAAVEPRAQALLEAAIAAVPFLAAADFEAAAKAWARAEARCELLAAYLDERGLLDEEGRPRAAAALLIRCERLALEHRGRLGLDPRSRVELERALVELPRGRPDLEQLVAEGRRALEARRDEEKG